MEEVCNINKCIFDEFGCALKVNPNWQENWLTYISTDFNNDSYYFIRLMLVKLRNMYQNIKERFELDKNHLEPAVCEHVDTMIKDLETAYNLGNLVFIKEYEEETIDEDLKKDTKVFFDFVAEHIIEWWYI